MIFRKLSVVSMIFLAVFAVVVVTVLAVSPGADSASPERSADPVNTPSEFAHLPIVQNIPAPTPPPTPTNPPYSAAATLYITPDTDLLASTFNTASFVVNNDSLNGQRLTELRIDLRTRLFPDMVFDPYGKAGDTVAKDVVVDVREGLNFDGHFYESPHGGGFDQLILRFRNFDRGDRFAFSVDVDPTSITGVAAPGPHLTGSVGGLELVGATITATFDDGTVLVNQSWRMDGSSDPNHSGAVAVLRPGLPERPVLEVVDGSSPAMVGSPDQVIRISGPVGRPVVLLVVEGGLFTAGVPGGGVDLDPFEANTALGAREFTGVIGLAGILDIPVTLRKSMPEGGISYITAVFDNHYGVKGMIAAPLALQLP